MYPYPVPYHHPLSPNQYQYFIIFPEEAGVKLPNHHVLRNHAKVPKIPPAYSIKRVRDITAILVRYFLNKKILKKNINHALTY